ncbi:MAG TPA: AAA family ATPase [Xanthobacteraceae bacterium]|jgi:predicted ATP-dependent endonuclease of OLD family
MQLKAVSVKNFRSIRNVSVNVSDQMAIVGGNGAGKSSVLRAIDRFFSPSTNVELDDFFARQVSAPIEIGLTFTNFSESERKMFATRIHNNEMTVVRVFEVTGGKSNGRYYGATMQHPGFATIRAAEGANPTRAAYNTVRQSDPMYSDLPTVSRAEQIGEALQKWEAEHIGQCELARDDGQFFGFTNVARGALQKATSFVFIPAVRDASADALDARGAVIAKLLELVVRNAIQQRSDIQSFQSRISREYRELTDPEKLQELAGLSGDLTDTLKQFYKEAAVELRWKPTEDFAIPLPAADVTLDDDGFVGPVDRKGHGLQRAFILTLLQHLAKATSADIARQDASPPIAPAPDEEGSPLAQQPGSAYAIPGLILAIEEPELYQHPTKQRHFAKVLSQLSVGELPGVARHTQVLFATHSSLFVSMDRFDEVRLARRHKSPESEHKECRVTYSTLSEVTRRLEKAYGKAEGTFSPAGLKARLHIIDAEIAEGLFADTVVLVEGVSDRAAILAAAALANIDLEALGVAVLAVDGKTKMDRPAAIFTSLEIPTFPIWDCDKKSDGSIDSVEQNHAMQALMGVAPEDIIDASTVIAKTYACFEETLEVLIKSEIGAELYMRQINVVKTKYSIDRNDDAEKAPFAMRELLAGAAAEGKRSRTLNSIVDAIKALREESSGRARGPAVNDNSQLESSATELPVAQERLSAGGESD